MKGRIHLLIPLLAGSMLTASACQGAAVFSDDFSEASGTAIIGKSPDVGNAWTGVDNGTAVSAGNTLKTDGDGRTMFGGFASALGTGQMLTLTYDTLSFGGGSFNGYAGVSLYSGGSGGNERVFTGNLGNANSWGVDGSALGNHAASPADTTTATSATFTYIYDSGAWTFTTTSGVNLSGTGTANAALDTLRVANGNGGDIEVDNLVVDISPVPVFSFVSRTPANGSYSAPVGGTISVQTTDGASPVNTNTIVMKVDGGTVTPSISKAANVTTISYDPVTPLSAGALHSVEVTLAEDGGTAHTNTWSFTTGFPSLPLTLPGPISASEFAPVSIFTTNGDPWLSTNYNTSSAETLYTRFSLVFDDLNGEDGGGGGFGGLHFFRNDNTTDVLLIGNNWPSTNWSIDHITAADDDLTPLTPIVLGEWHTMVVRTDYNPSGDDTTKIWLDPDFGQTEAAQPFAPLTVVGNTSFNRIRLRCGNGTASATWSNIIVGALSTDVGFQASASPVFESFLPGVGAVNVAPTSPVGVQVFFGSYGISTNDVVFSLDGNNVSPGFVVASNSITMSYQPGSPFSPGSVHNVAVSVTDSNAAEYSTNWSFTVDQYPSLPVSLTGPYNITGGGVGTTVWTSNNGWIGSNYDSSSTNRLYTRYTMKFSSLDGETGSGGAFGGLHFYRGGSEGFIVGNNWPSINWSFEAADPFQASNLSPVTPIVLDEWRTIVIRTDFVSGGNDVVKVWFDPDLSKSEGSQTNAPLELSFNNTFDNVHLRCGNNTAAAQYTNIIMAATALEIGFAQPVPTAQDFLLGAQSGIPATVQVVGGKFAPTDNDGGVLSIVSVGNATNGTAGTDGTNITYTSGASYTGPDSFTYTVTNGIGGSAVGTVTVSVVANGTGYNQLGTPVAIGDGKYELTFLGIPGQNYALELTHDLTPPVAWEAVITNVVGNNGYLRFTNTPSESPTNDYLRTKHVP